MAELFRRRRTGAGAGVLAVVDGVCESGPAADSLASSDSSKSFDSADLLKLIDSFLRIILDPGDAEWTLGP